MTPAELALKNAMMVELIDIARERNLAKAVCEDIASRAIKSGKVFLNNTTGQLDTVAGYSARDYVELLSEDRSAVHLFNSAENAKAKPATIYGMPVDEFNKLTAIRRLEIANKDSMKNQKSRK